MAPLLRKCIECASFVEMRKDTICTKYLDDVTEALVRMYWIIRVLCVRNVGTVYQLGRISFLAKYKRFTHDLL
jgi:hypothetical protein